MSICERCNTLEIRDNSTYNICDKCYKALLHLEQDINKYKKDMSFKCVSCGKTFDRRKFAQVTCSKACNQRHRLSFRDKPCIVDGKRVAWNKGIQASDEVRQKMSDAKKGKTTWNLGIPHSEETKQKIAEKALGRESYWKGKELPEHMIEALKPYQFKPGEKPWNYTNITTHCSECNKELKIRPYKLELNRDFFCSRECFFKSKKGKQAWNKGIPMREESKLKQAESMQGIEPWNKGIEMSDEFKEKQRISHLGQIPWNKTDTIKVCHMCQREQHIKPAYLKRDTKHHFCSADCKGEYQKTAYLGTKNAFYGKTHTKEVREIISRTAMKTMENRKLGHYDRTYLYGGVCMKSSWEMMFAMWLDEQGIEWEYEPRFNLKENNIDIVYFPDFYIKDLDAYVEIKGWNYEGGSRKYDNFKDSMGKQCLFLDKNVLKFLGVFDYIDLAEEVMEANMPEFMVMED